MDTLGNWLQTAREAKGIELEDVEAATRIRVRYLEALEAGDYQAMPSGVAQARGFLRRYATFLGLSPDEAIARHDREVTGQPTEVASDVSSPPSPAPPTEMAITASPWRGWPIVGVVGLAILVILVGGWLAINSGLFARSEATPTPIPVATETQAATEVATTLPAPTDVPSPAQVTPTFPVVTSGDVTLTLEPLEHTWVRVTADGFVVFEGMLAPGSPQTWVGAEMVVVETGNGGGVVAIVNDQPQDVLCGRGEICARGWGPEGEIEVPPPSTSAGGG